MEDITETRVPNAFSAWMAGLQAGMLGALWMLAWLGVSSAWQNQGFWSLPNLFATAFYGSDAVRSNFGLKTCPGLALFLLIYCLLGGFFALIVRRHSRSGSLTLTGVVFSIGWFYLSFHLLWKTALPLVYLLYAERPLVVGHLIYGVCVGRFRAHFPVRSHSSQTDISQETAPPAPDVAVDALPPKPPIDAESGSDALPEAPEVPADAKSDVPSVSSTERSLD